MSTKINKLISNRKRIGNILVGGPLLCTRIIIKESNLANIINDINIICPIKKRASIVNIDFVSTGETSDVLKMEPHIYYLMDLNNEANPDAYKDIGKYEAHKWQLTIGDWIDKQITDDKIKKACKTLENLYIAFKVTTAGTKPNNNIVFKIEYIDSGVSENLSLPEFCTTAP